MTAACDAAASMRQPSATRGRARSRGASPPATTVFRRLTRAAALVVLLILGGVIVSLVIGAMPAFRAFGFGFFTTRSWNPVTEKFGALAPIYGTRRHLAHRHADRRAGRHRHRDLPDRAVPAVACAGRSASPSNCSRAFPASSTASGACSSSRRSCSSMSSRR